MAESINQIRNVKEVEDGDYKHVSCQIFLNTKKTWKDYKIQFPEAQGLQDDGVYTVHWSPDQFTDKKTGQLVKYSRPTNFVLKEAGSVQNTPETSTNGAQATNQPQTSHEPSDYVKAEEIKSKNIITSVILQSAPIVVAAHPDKDPVQLLIACMNAMGDFAERKVVGTKNPLANPEEAKITGNPGKSIEKKWTFQIINITQRKGPTNTEYLIAADNGEVLSTEDVDIANMAKEAKSDKKGLTVWYIENRRADNTPWLIIKKAETVELEQTPF